MVIRLTLRVIHLDCLDADERHPRKLLDDFINSDRPRRVIFYVFPHWPHPSTLWGVHGAGWGSNKDIKTKFDVFKDLPTRCPPPPLPPPAVV